MEKYNLDYENKLLNLLGYSCKLNNQNELIIFDDNNKEVGYIEIDNSSEDIKYHTVIDSDTIKFNKVRTFNPESYWINVKDVGYVYIKFDQKSCAPGETIFSIVSDKYGRYNIYNSKVNRGINMTNIGENSLKFSCGYKVGDYSVFESVDFSNKGYSNTNLHKTYEYKLTYSKSPATKKGSTLFAYNSCYKPDVLCSHIRTFEFDGDKYNETITDLEERKQTVEEFAVEHNRGIELFEQLRNLIKQILPFKEDVIYELFEDKIDEYGLKEFFNKEKSIIK